MYLQSFPKLFFLVPMIAFIALVTSDEDALVEDMGNEILEDFKGLEREPRYLQWFRTNKITYPHSNGTKANLCTTNNCCRFECGTNTCPATPTAVQAMACMAGAATVASPAYCKIVVAPPCIAMGGNCMTAGTTLVAGCAMVTTMCTVVTATNFNCAIP